MQHPAPPDAAVEAVQRDVGVRDVDVGHAVRPGLNVAQVANMAVGRVRGAVAELTGNGVSFTIESLPCMEPLRLIAFECWPLCLCH